MNIKEKIKLELKNNSDEKYKKFSSSLVPNCSNMLGVRLPFLRKTAKKIIKDDWKSFLNSKAEFFEETMLKGMVIGLLDEDIKTVLNYIDEFIKEINNWSVCDSFVSGLKIINKNKEAVFSYIQKFLTSEKEFEIRFYLVVLLNYFSDIEYINQTLNSLEKICLEGYYAKTGAGWLISICYIKFPEITEKFLTRTKIDPEAFNIGIQKIIESKRVEKNIKDKLKSLKKNIKAAS